MISSTRTGSLLRFARAGAALSVSAACLLSAAEARADRPFVVLRDPDIVATSPMKTTADLIKVRNTIRDLYVASGQPIPEIMSVWTTFPLGGYNVGTRFFGYANDVTGIGLEEFYFGDGTFESNLPPLRSMLLHNNALGLADAASYHEAPVEGYGLYLFLLELSHTWGPALKVPGDTPGQLVGFPFHWSFFMDAGGSPAGGNVWKDNGDGTFDVVPGTPATVAFSPVDLYTMGLLAPAEVPPFSVLTNVTVPPDAPEDPIWTGPVEEHTFPWFNAGAKLTVSATRQMWSIDDVIAANGERDPPAGTKTDWTLGIVLIERGTATLEEEQAHREAFADLAGSLAPGFATATGQLGSMTVVTSSPDPISGEGGAGGAGASGGGGAGGKAEGGSGGGGGSDGAGSGCSCVVAGQAPQDRGGGAWFVAAVAALAGAARRKKRHPRAHAP